MLVQQNIVNVLNATEFCTSQQLNFMSFAIKTYQGNISSGSQLFIFSYCRYFANEPFADFHRVEGLQGVYIATLINGSMNEENMRSVITFDKGGTWEFLQAPAFTEYGEKINCEVEMVSSCLSFYYTFFCLLCCPYGSQTQQQGT